METILWLLLLAALAWFWQDSLRVREKAYARCQLFCKQQNVQLLDQTIHLKKIIPGRLLGRLGLRRFYVFEFATTGDDRYQGIIVLFGMHLEYLSLLHPNGEIIDHASLRR